ncbi:indole-3-glycerol phosphate synthase [Rathayibacter tritici]|uniref:indole-3-glycerol phosphate synthase n=1 Tax=Rathayibacter tritici TaxID=33888 RepID=UPI000CE8E160|nr:indole-3-glycerol phosphate synthase [Rathayibacter tritici]PPF66087.1 indole-3-glycerol phosphate synthase [Rathayibacter tritici]PPG06656.1 indole-3-glycerol phosphate synthase [Rathayibacter tritici]
MAPSSADKGTPGSAAVTSPSQSRFIDAVLDSDCPLIMEVKRRSADGEDLMLGRTPTELVELFERGGAPCISVVTGRWFGGDGQLLAEVAAATDRPILQKDFLTRHDQLERSAEAGVSAVLLTVQLLHRDSLSSLIDHSLAVGLTPFVEAVSAAEIAMIPRAEECVIAVNNKQIRDRESGPVDLPRSLKMIDLVIATGTRLPVSASGIDTPETVERLVSAGYKGLLVGTSLLAGGLADRLSEPERAASATATAR